VLLVLSIRHGVVPEKTLNESRRRPSDRLPRALPRVEPCHAVCHANLDGLRRLVTG